jgi:hypothetical protein
MSPNPFSAPNSKFDLALAIRAFGPCSSFSPRRRAFILGVGGRHPDAPTLEREVIEIQGRLGTPAERRNDLARARAVAHKLANLTCVALLRRERDAFRGVPS